MDNKKDSIRFTLARKITIWILLISGVFTILSSIFQLYIDYNTGIKEIEKILNIIEISHIKSLENEVWNMDESNIITQLDEILNMPHISYVYLKRKNIDDIFRGNIPVEKFQIKREYSLYYKDDRLNKTIEIGVLTVVASLQNIFDILKEKIIVIIVTQSIKTFFVSFFIIFLIYSLITKHLDLIGKYLQTIDLTNFPGTLKIFKIHFLNFGAKDELDLLVSKINSMQIDLKKSINDLRNANIDLENEIEERKKVEKKLLETKLFNETILNASPDIIYVYDIVKKINIYSNEGINRVLGYTVNEIQEMGDKMIEYLMHPDDYPTYLNETIQKYKNAKDNEYIKHEYRMKNKNGDWCWLISKESIFHRNEDGSPEQIFGIIADITIRKQSEIALSQEKERLHVTLRSIGDGVITTDTKGRIILINKSAEVLTGWTQFQAVGKHIKEVFNIVHEHSRHVCENPVEKVLESRKTVEIANNTSLISRDGTERMIADSGAPIFDSSQEIIGVVLVFRDVTEKYKIEKQLQQTQKMEAIGTLAGGIAHDFNNMLGVITGNISYVLSNFNSDNELYEVLYDIQKSSLQATNLTKQLLTFSKGGAPIKKITNINKIIEESAIFSTRGSKASCKFELSNDLCLCDVDKGQINQVISNLVINANQAMPNGGTIHIKTENVIIDAKNDLILHPGQYIKIEIEDKGTGIPKNHIPNIFEPYFTTKQKGSGLGLATAYSIIKKHDGIINVKSEIEKGTIFIIYLPASLKAIEEIEIKKTTKHSGSGKILIMDDQKPILKMLSRILNRMGYSTESAIDGKKVIEMYSKVYNTKDSFDLVILDLTIPGGMGGIETIMELLKIDPNVKAVVSSGYSNDPIMANYKKYGFCGVVPKPYTKNQLAEVLNNI